MATDTSKGLASLPTPIFWSVVQNLTLGDVRNLRLSSRHCEHQSLIPFAERFFHYLKFERTDNQEKISTRMAGISAAPALGVQVQHVRLSCARDSKRAGEASTTHNTPNFPNLKKLAICDLDHTDEDPSTLPSPLQPLLSASIVNATITQLSLENITAPFSVFSHIVQGLGPNLTSLQFSVCCVLDASSWSLLLLTARRLPGLNTCKLSSLESQSGKWPFHPDAWAGQDVFSISVGPFRVTKWLRGKDGKLEHYAYGASYAEMYGRAAVLAGLEAVLRNYGVDVEAVEDVGVLGEEAEAETIMSS